MLLEHSNFQAAVTYEIIFPIEAWWLRESRSYIWRAKRVRELQEIRIGLKINFDSTPFLAFYSWFDTAYVYCQGYYFLYFGCFKRNLCTLVSFSSPKLRKMLELVLATCVLRRSSFLKELEKLVEQEYVGGLAVCDFSKKALEQLCKAAKVWAKELHLSYSLPSPNILLHWKHFLTNMVSLF